jgi:hypothetical protein
MVDRTRLKKAVKRFLVASDMHRSDQPNTPYVKIMGPSVDDVEAVLVAARAVVEAPEAFVDALEIYDDETYAVTVHIPRNEAMQQFARDHLAQRVFLVPAEEES